MKHTFVFIDKLIILLKYVPRSLDTAEDLTRAKNTIILIKAYTQTLENLITNHKNKVYLERLQQVHLDKIENWAEQVTTVFKKMDNLLKMLTTDAEKLAAVIENEPEKWQPTIADMAFGMVMTGLHDEEEEMVRLRNIAIFEIHELEEIISHQQHLAELHQWQKFMELSEAEQLIEHEKHFAELLK